MPDNAAKAVCADCFHAKILPGGEWYRCDVNRLKNKAIRRQLWRGDGQPALSAYHHRFCRKFEDMDEDEEIKG